MPVEYVQGEELKAALLAKQPGLVVIDVRDDDRVGAIKGAVHKASSSATWADESQLQEWVRAVSSSSTNVVFHCQQSLQRGPRCARAFVEALEALQLENPPAVKVLSGGYGAWERAYSGSDEVNELFEK